MSSKSTWIYVDGGGENAVRRLAARVDVAGLRKAGMWGPLKRDLMAAWVKSAEKILSGKKNYASRYKAGISIETTEDQIRFRVSGFEAMKIELGWAVPDAPGDLADGVGEWTGKDKNMRPFMGVGAKGFKHIHMGFFQSIPEIVAETREKMIENAFSSRGANTRAKNLLAKNLEADIRALKPGGKYTGDRLSREWDDLLPKHQEKHGAPLVSRIKRLKGGKLSNWRTITNKKSQTSRRLWYTRGVEPNLILEQTRGTFVTLIVDQIIDRVKKG